MTKDQEKILTKYMIRWQGMIVSNLDRQKGSGGAPSTASGKSASGIGYEINKGEDSAILFGPGHLVNLIYGREKGRMPPVEELQQWARERGFDDPESAGWAIAKKIAKEGTEWNKTGGESDIISSVITQKEINMLTDELAVDTRIRVSALINDALK